MAEPNPLPAALPADRNLLPAVQQEEPLSKELRQGLEQFLGNYQSRMSPKVETDRLDNRYVIETGKPLPQLDTATAKAYSAIDEMTPNRVMYALVCDKHLPVRQELAKALQGVENNHLLALYGCGIVNVSVLREERFVLFYERPKGKTLRELVDSQQQAFSDRYIRERVIIPLNEALTIIEGLNATHGRVNPNNIFIDEGRLILGECCSEPCGYSQDFHYDPINYIQCHPAGKGSGFGTVDYYALGIVIALMKRKPKMLQVKNKNNYVRRMLHDGSYIGIIGYIDLSDEMTDFLRGVLNDNPLERWTSKQVTAWCKGKRYNLLTPTIPSISSRPFEFEDTNFHNLRQLGEVMYHHPEHAVTILQDNSLSRWIEISTRRREISEYIAKVVKSYRTLTNKSARELIARCMFALDQHAPVRLENISVHIDGVSTLLAELYFKKEEKGLVDIREAIVQSIFSAWQEAMRTVFNYQKLSTPQQQAIWALDRARLNIRNNSAGFGIERLLYDLNPTLPCQSPILKSHYVTDIPQLLLALDQIATQKNRPYAPMDRHIAGFIGSKLSLSNVISFTEYAYYPQLANHEGLVALKFLQKCQITCKNILVPGLSAWLTSSIAEVIGTFNSKTIRKHLCGQMAELGKQGDLITLLDYVTAVDYSSADGEGFVMATHQYAQYVTKIAGLQNTELLEFRSFRLGNTIAKFISYAVLIAVFIFYFNQTE